MINSIQLPGRMRYKKQIAGLQQRVGKLHNMHIFRLISTFSFFFFLSDIL